MLEKCTVPIYLWSNSFTSFQAFQVLEPVRTFSWVLDWLKMRVLPVVSIAVGSGPKFPLFSLPPPPSFSIHNWYIRQCGWYIAFFQVTYDPFCIRTKQSSFACFSVAACVHGTGHRTVTFEFLLCLLTEKAPHLTPFNPQTGQDGLGRTPPGFQSFPCPLVKHQVGHWRPGQLSEPAGTQGMCVHPWHLGNHGEAFRSV